MIEFSEKQSKKNESKIQNEGISCALSLGVELTRTNAGKVKVRGGWMQLACKGWGDTTGYNHNGVIVMIEFKDVVSFNSKNHGANEDQLKRLNDIKLKGGICGIACCDEHVKSIISGNYVGLI
tara:strand:- start:1329 stop:1697 length:369 start_codon:yes stop_codon:yes gene_type:complete